MRVPIHKVAKYWNDATTAPRQSAGSAVTGESCTNELNDDGPQDRWRLDQRCIPNHGPLALPNTKDHVKRERCS